MKVQIYVASAEDAAMSAEAGADFVGLVADESGKATQIAAFETESIDTVGAGDVHSAGFILAVLEGKPDTEAARWGNALAALSVSREGASGHLTRTDLDALLAS